MNDRVLIIAGSDSGGGAGVQADIKTVTALGGYAMSALTAITVQNTLGVSAIHPVPEDIVRAQIEAVVSDLGADVWKIGMLGSAALTRVVARAYRDLGAGAPLVLDPVMIAKGGAALLEADAIEVLRDELLPLAALITPNAPEAEALTGLSVTDAAGQAEAGARLIARGARAALVKGGHIAGETIHDVLVDADGVETFSSARIETRATHGTGCTLGSAIATGLAQGWALKDAIIRARAYLRGAILHAPGLGAGHGPLGHGWTADLTKLT